MDPRTAASQAPDPDAVAFVRFCYHRRRVGWPELYDEMCAVAARGLYRGYGSDDLAGIGIGFALFDMPALATLANQVIEEERASRRPMTVVLTDALPSERVAVEVVAEPVAIPVAMSVEADVEAHAFSVVDAPPAPPVVRPVIEPAPRPEPTLRFRPVPAGA